MRERMVSTRALEDLKGPEATRWLNYVRIQMDSSSQTLGPRRDWIQWGKGHRSHLSELRRTRIATHPAMRAAAPPGIGPTCVCMSPGMGSSPLSR